MKMGSGLWYGVGDVVGGIGGVCRLLRVHLGCGGYGYCGGWYFFGGYVWGAGGEVYECVDLEGLLGVLLGLGGRLLLYGFR